MPLPPAAAPYGTAHVALWGDAHPALGHAAVDSLDDDTAVALSAGKLPKPYPHLDANEDAVLAARGNGGTLLAVVDGHSGFDAARAALAAVVANAAVLDAPQIEQPEQLAQALLMAARDGVREALHGALGPRSQSRAALSLALLVDKRVFVGGWGDTQAVRIRGGRTKLLGSDTAFLEPSSSVPSITGARLKKGDVVMVCSDGVRDYIEGKWSDRIAELVATADSAPGAARLLIEAAWSGGAGDHLSVGLSRWTGRPGAED